MNKCKCKHCGEVIMTSDMGNLNILMWFHLKEEHHAEFKKQKDKTIQQLLDDNYEKLK